MGCSPHRTRSGAEQALDTAKADEDWLRDALDALDQLAPKAGEEESLKRPTHYARQCYKNW